MIGFSFIVALLRQADAAMTAFSSRGALQLPSKLTRGRDPAAVRRRQPHRLTLVPYYARCRRRASGVVLQMSSSSDERLPDGAEDAIKYMLESTPGMEKEFSGSVKAELLALTDVDTANKTLSFRTQGEALPSSPVTLTFAKDASGEQLTKENVTIVGRAMTATTEERPAEFRTGLVIKSVQRAVGKLGLAITEKAAADIKLLVSIGEFIMEKAMTDTQRVSKQVDTATQALLQQIFPQYANLTVSQALMLLPILPPATSERLLQTLRFTGKPRDAVLAELYQREVDRRFNMLKAVSKAPTGLAGIPDYFYSMRKEMVDGPAGQRLAKRFPGLASLRDAVARRGSKILLDDNLQDLVELAEEEQWGGAADADRSEWGPASGGADDMAHSAGNASSPGRPASMEEIIAYQRGRCESLQAGSELERRAVNETLPTIEALLKALKAVQMTPVGNTTVSSSPERSLQLVDVAMKDAEATLQRSLTKERHRLERLDVSVDHTIALRDRLATLEGEGAEGRVASFDVGEELDKRQLPRLTSALDQEAAARKKELKATLEALQSLQKSFEDFLEPRPANEEASLVQGVGGGTDPMVPPRPTPVNDSPPPPRTVRPQPTPVSSAATQPSNPFPYQDGRPAVVPSPSQPSSPLGVLVPAADAHEGLNPHLLQRADALPAAVPPAAAADPAVVSALQSLNAFTGRAVEALERYDVDLQSKRREYEEGKRPVLLNVAGKLEVTKRRALEVTLDRQLSATAAPAAGGEETESDRKQRSAMKAGDVNLQSS
mmetsp:Transcript_18526/g.52911  ORF Transcript_18526/g.52911 Transcript_18526/m.52911 type:complete len:778 (+) Transcript_18526:38-2371(+)